MPVRKQGQKRFSSFSFEATLSQKKPEERRLILKKRTQKRCMDMTALFLAAARMRDNTIRPENKSGEDVFARQPSDFVSKILKWNLLQNLA